MSEGLNEVSPRAFGTEFALFKGRGTERMSSRVIKILIGALTILLLASALSHLTERHSTTPTRPLLLLGGGLISLASLTRRHFADEEE